MEKNSLNSSPYLELTRHVYRNVFSYLVQTFSSCHRRLFRVGHLRLWSCRILRVNGPIATNSDTTTVLDPSRHSRCIPVGRAYDGRTPVESTSCQIWARWWAALIFPWWILPTRLNWIQFITTMNTIYILPKSAEGMGDMESQLHLRDISMQDLSMPHWQMWLELFDPDQKYRATPLRSSHHDWATPLNSNGALTQSYLHQTTS